MRVSALIVVIMSAVVMTGAVLGMATFGKMSAQNMPVLAPLAPAKDSTTALDVINPKLKQVTSNDLIERPMFWKERRPYVPPVKIDNKKNVVGEVFGPDPFEMITLMGIYSSGVMLKVDGEIQRVRIGETIEGLDWSLDAIGKNDQVLFVFGAEEKFLTLEHAQAKTSQQARKIPQTRKVPNKKDKSNKKDRWTKMEQDKVKQETIRSNGSTAKKKSVEYKNKGRVELGQGLK